MQESRNDFFALNSLVCILCFLSVSGYGGWEDPIIDGGC